MSGELIRPGGAPHHRCDQPNISLKIRHNAVWRCDCGRRWKLHVKQTSSASWEGRWVRRYWPWPRLLDVEARHEETL